MRAFVAILLAIALCGCTPLVAQRAGTPPIGFQGARLEADAFVSFDGARLGLTRWEARGEPWAVVVALHGMNDYANAFHLAAPYWAQNGVTTYAYDQRGFGRSPRRGIWGGDELMQEDARTAVALARAAHPKAVIVLMGESMGGAVAAAALASDRPPQADRVVLLAPAVWGWKDQPLPNRTLLWLAARFTGPKVYTPPDWVLRKISPTDNRDELVAMGRDRLMIWGARSDTIYGLVRMMDKGGDAVGGIRIPAYYLYGANDQIIPKRAAARASRKLKPTDRSAYYPKGWHLLTRDRQGPRVWADILAFMRDPTGPAASGTPKIPVAPTLDAAGL